MGAFGTRITAMSGSSGWRRSPRSPAPARRPRRCSASSVSRPTEMQTASLADYLVALDHVPGLANAGASQGRRVRAFCARGWSMKECTDRPVGSRQHRLVADGFGRRGRAQGAARDAGPAGVAGRQRQDDGRRRRAAASHGHWDTTTANAWGTVAARRFAALYPASAITGTTRLSLAGRSVAKGLAA